MTTPQDRAAVQAAMAIAEAIKGLGSVPSGHLYARLMGHMSLSTYNTIIDFLKRNNVVKESGNLLTWVGGEGLLRAGVSDDEMGAAGRYSAAWRPSAGGLAKYIGKLHGYVSPGGVGRYHWSVSIPADSRWGEFRHKILYSGVESTQRAAMAAVNRSMRNERKLSSVVFGLLKADASDSIDGGENPENV